MRLGSKPGCVSPSPVPTLRGTHTAPTVCLSRAGAGGSLRWEAAATGRMWAAPRAKGERLPVHLESTASHPREGRLHGEGPARCRGPRVQHVDSGAPHLSRRTSADPGRGWQRSFQKVAEQLGQWTIVSLQAPSPSSEKVPLGDQRPPDEEGASQSPSRECPALDSGSARGPAQASSRAPWPQAPPEVPGCGSLRPVADSTLGCRACSGVCGPP